MDQSEEFEIRGAHYKLGLDSIRLQEISEFGDRARNDLNKVIVTLIATILLAS
jgi:hypothetical protein